MRARVPQQAPRLSGARFLAGCRSWADPCRRVIPSIAWAFLAFLLALGFRGSNFAQLLLDSATEPVEASAAAGQATAPGRPASLHSSASGTTSEIAPRGRPPSQQTEVGLPVRAGHTDKSAGKTINARVSDGPDGKEFALRIRYEYRFKEAPDYERPGDAVSADPESPAGDNEYVVVVEVSSGQGERERSSRQVIRVRVSDEEEPPGAPEAPEVTPEGTDRLKVSWREPENRGPETQGYEVRYRQEGEAGYGAGGMRGRDWG